MRIAAPVISFRSTASRCEKSAGSASGHMPETAGIRSRPLSSRISSRNRCHSFFTHGEFTFSALVAITIITRADCSAA